MSELKIYHRCYSGYEDGTKLLIKKGELYLHATNEPFWKCVNMYRTNRNKINGKEKKRVKAKYLNKENTLLLYFKN